MTLQYLQDTLAELLRLPSETEWVEFKEAGNSYDFDKMGKYFSALSNEANLKQKPCGWLVFGVKDKPREIAGTEFRRDRVSLDSLKYEMAQSTNGRITFEEIHELNTEKGRVVMFQIPPAPPGVPTSWKGHYYGREGESIGALSLSELEQIRGQSVQDDWSAKVCDRASLSDLDSEAILFARKQYAEKHPHRVDEIRQWDDQTFLNKAKICISGKVTNTALLLLGTEESTHFLLPAIAQISWMLKDEHDAHRDYQHFYPPFLLSVEQVFKKIRNLTYRYMPDTTLFPTEISQYDPWVIREMLHNCIAHQDYSLEGRINVVEKPDSLLVTNLGNFLPGSVEEVICRDAPGERYRNYFLCQAMVNLNMIDTIGSGIKRMFVRQRERFLPMPDFNLEEPGRVEVRLFGKILDENYTRMLIEKTDINLMDVIALDKVQKERPLSDGEMKSVRSQRLVEGRRPNLFVSAKIAAVTGEKATYIKQRGFDKEHYKRMVISYLEKFGEAKRKDFDDLLLSKISDALSDEQKSNRVRNLLQEMRRDGIIQPVRTGSSGKWVLSKRAKGEGV